MFNLFSGIYDVIATVCFIVFYPFVAIARLHTGKDTGTRKIKLGLFNSPDIGNKVIMYHAVSVGEVLSLEKLIKKTKEKFPEYKLVLTTGTKTGQELAKKKFANIADFITYFPFDIPFAVKNFLNKINPSIVLIAETELWPEFAIQCKKRSIPLCIINGRISDSSYSSYKKLKLFFGPILRLYSKVYTQSILDNERFITVGTRKQDTEVMKNLKFDIDKVEDSIDLHQGNSKILIAGSTHSGEDKIIIDAYIKLKQKIKSLKLIIAPRHLERISEIEKILAQFPVKVGYRSKQDNFEHNDIILLDTLGELKKVYSICTAAIIGGSFNNTGGHNPLEAAIYNVPTITGPSIKNFRDIYSLLFRASASTLVNNGEELYEYLDKLLNDDEFYQNTVEACKTIFDDQKGALDFVIDKIQIMLTEKTDE